VRLHACPGVLVILAAEAYRRSREWLEGQQIEAERVDLELKGFEGTAGVVTLSEAGATGVSGNFEVSLRRSGAADNCGSRIA